MRRFFQRFNFPGRWRLGLWCLLRRGWAGRTVVSTADRSQAQHHSQHDSHHISSVSDTEPKSPHLSLGVQPARSTPRLPMFTGDTSSSLLHRFYREARTAAAPRHSIICPEFEAATAERGSKIAIGGRSGCPWSALARFVEPHRPSDRVAPGDRSLRCSRERPFSGPHELTS